MPGFNTTGFGLGNISTKQSSTPSKLVIPTSGSGNIVFTPGILLASQTLTIPAGANFCRVIAMGAGATGYTTANGNSATTSSGGSGAIAISGFAVTPGASLNLTIGASGAGGGTGGTAGTPTSFVYNGVTVCSADGGYIVSGSGIGGLISNCIFNIEAIAGLSGTQGSSPTGTLTPLDKNGVSRLPYYATYGTHPGQGGGANWNTTNSAGGPGQAFVLFTTS